MGMTESDVRAVERLIWFLHRDGGGVEYRANPAEFLEQRWSEFGLEGPARQLIVDCDYGGLIEAGVHPMAALFFSQVNGLPMPLYLERIGAGPERVAEFKAAFQRIHGGG